MECVIIINASASSAIWVKIALLVKIILTLKEMSSKGYRIPLWLLIIIFVVLALLGFGLAFLIFWLIRKCCLNAKSGIQNYREIDVAVKWERKEDK